MPIHPSPSLPLHDALLDAGERLLQSTVTRAVLSLFIVLSVLPAEAYQLGLPTWLARRTDPFFLIVFLPELVLRILILARRIRHRRAFLRESFVLLADLVALVSFLPLASDFLWLRLLRLSRLVLLVGYWGRLVADLWRVVSSRERRYQIGLVLVLALVTSFVTAILLFELGPAFDYDENGVVDVEDARFVHVFWWSFRQLPDPGNLITNPSHLTVAFASLVLTFSGLLLFSFIVGISAGVMGEMMRRARDRAPGLRQHTVLLGIGASGRLLIEDLLAMYRKNRRPCRLAVLGSSSESPEWLDTSALKEVVYRSGDSMRVDDLTRVDVVGAKRVLVMTESGPAADARAVAALLAVRSLSQEVDVFLDVEHEKDFPAARMAGGPHTHIIGTGTLVGYMIAHNAVHPGANRAVRQLLSEGGNDLYTYFYSPEERARLCASCRRLSPSTLFQRFLRQGVTLLGAFVGPERSEHMEELKVLFNLFDVTRDAAPYFEDGCLRSELVFGFVGICVKWADLRSNALELLLGPPREETMAPAPPASPVPLLQVRPPRRVLICGTSGRVPRVIAELMGYAGALEVTLLTSASDAVTDMVEGLRSILEATCPMPLGEGKAIWNVEALPGGHRIDAEFPCGRVSLRILLLDWTDTGRLLRHPLLDFMQMDVMLFLPSVQDDVTDGLVAIDCLRLAHALLSSKAHINPDLRVVALLADPTKTELLESRLDESSPESETRFTVLSSEHLRQRFVVRNVFVRGLSPLLFELLSVQGHHLQRFVPAWPDGKAAEGCFDAWALVRHLIEHEHLLPIGFELDGQSEPILDARILAPGQSIPRSKLRAVYVIGRLHLSGTGNPQAVDPALATDPSGGG